MSSPDKNAAPSKPAASDAGKAPVLPPKAASKPLVPGAKVFATLGPPNAITSTRHLSLEKPDSVEAPQNRFSIYDLKAVKREILTVFDAAENGDNRAITKFSKVKNFDVDAKDRYGRTALIWAADCGHLHAIETLIRLSANIHATDNHTGRSAIHWAARAGNLPIVKLLVTYGANFTREDRFGLTPVYLAKSIGAAGMDCFEYLLAEGAPYNETKSIDIAAAEEDIAKEMQRLAAETEEADAKAADEARASSSSGS